MLKMTNQKVEIIKPDKRNYSGQPNAAQQKIQGYIHIGGTAFVILIVILGIIKIELGNTAFYIALSLLTAIAGFAVYFYITKKR